MKEQIIDIITKASELEHDTVAVLLEIPPKADMGDFAFPCWTIKNNYHR